MLRVIATIEQMAHEVLHRREAEGNGHGTHCHLRGLRLDAKWYIEEPGEWMRGAKAGKSWGSVVKLQRAIGAWVALTGAQPVADSDVKEALTGRKHAPKSQVQWALKALGYEFTENNEADAVALGHFMSNKLALEARVNG